jgi:glycosyltransferase involved in cell wall biosynthesis
MEDLRILEKLGVLNTFHFKASKSIFSLVWNFFHQFLWLIGNIRNTDLIYCWFSDYHSLLPTIFAHYTGKPIFIVNGGFDTVSNKELGYGIFCSAWRAPIGKYVLRNATLLLPVDKSLISSGSISKYWGESYPNGIMHHIPKLTTPWEELPTGYDPILWDHGSMERERIVSTVAFVSNHRTALIKGWDLFISAAKLLPKFQFRIVGCSDDFSKKLSEKYSLPENLHIIPPKPREELKDIYQNTSVYLQLSRSEGLPNVLCEAMLSGCVPIGSPVFGIPKLIGDAGFIAKKPDPILIAELVKKAHDQASHFRSKARSQIIDNFSLEKRSILLERIIFSKIYDN